MIVICVFKGRKLGLKGFKMPDIDGEAVLFTIWLAKLTDDVYWNCILLKL